MRRAGIDIGSRTVKVAVIEHDTVILARKRENSFHPISVAQELLAGVEYDVITATGYGRHLFANHFPCQVISEIKAFALGVRRLFPACHSILDIGGQDTKAIALDAAGRVVKFEMNDKCAAGTGRFLEIMAMALGYSLAEFGQAACSATMAEKINSMCTVFAESEVISMLARHADRASIALGIHQAVVARSVGMLRKIAVKDDVVFVGGVALNPAMTHLLHLALNTRIYTPEDPQMIGAIGCASHEA